MIEFGFILFLKFIIILFCIIVFKIIILKFLLCEGIIMILFCVSLLFNFCVGLYILIKLFKWYWLIKLISDVFLLLEL